MGHDTSALPGGHKITHSQHIRGRHWRQIVEWQLPPDDVLETFVNRFFVSVDWFMMASSMIFHVYSAFSNPETGIPRRVLSQELRRAAQRTTSRLPQGEFLMAYCPGSRTGGSLFFAITLGRCQ